MYGKYNFSLFSFFLSVVAGPAAAASDEGQPAAAASDEGQPAAAASDESQPAAAASDERQPAAAASDDGQPAAAAIINEIDKSCSSFTNQITNQIQELSSRDAGKFIHPFISLI
jgi:hypothetical protein